MLAEILVVPAFVPSVHQRPLGAKWKISVPGYGTTFEEEKKRWLPTCVKSAAHDALSLAGPLNRKVPAAVPSERKRGAWCSEVCAEKMSELPSAAWVSGPE